MYFVCIGVSFLFISKFLAIIPKNIGREIKYAPKYKTNVIATKIPNLINVINSNEYIKLDCFSPIIIDNIMINNAQKLVRKLKGDIYERKSRNVM